MSEYLTEFDLETVYDEQISPLMEQIIAICKEHEIPVVASFCYAARPDDELGGEVTPRLCSTLLPFKGRSPKGFEAGFRVIKRDGNPPPLTFAITSNCNGPERH